ncbi:MAG: hypothetical protein ABR536_05310 [Solirubrobacterales bacterium]
MAGRGDLLGDNRGVVETILVLGLLPHAVKPYLALMIFGFAIGTFGHMARSKAMVAIGIGMILLATLLLPLAVVITNDTPPPPPGREVLPPGTR